MTAGAAFAYLYGSGFFDPTTKLRFEGHHPQARPDLWRQYLDGGVARYAKHGIGALLDRESIEEGEGVTLFFVGREGDGRVVAGVRCYGPLDSAAASQALAEMGSSPEADELARVVRHALPYGVLELKGAWGPMKGSGRHDLIKSLSRCGVHALTWLRCDLALGAVADRLHDPVVSSGGDMVGTESVPFPSERFRTVLMAWRRARITSDPDQALLLRDEARELAAGPPLASGGMGERVPDLSRGAGWRPIVLRSTRRSDREVVRGLSHHPAVTALDHLSEQQVELLGLLPTPSEAMVKEVPRFVYYPWRQVLVRMVGPAGFGAIRLDRNRHKITTEEQQRLRRLRVGILGLSVGHVIAHLLAMEGLCGELRLADPDRIETSNLNRIPATVLDVGSNKAVVAARRIAELDPYVDVSITPEGVNAENVDQFVAGLDVVLDECDSLDMKVEIREAAKRAGVAVLMETSDRGLLDVERFDLEPDRPIFHGLLPGVNSQSIADLSPTEKIPYVLGILEPGQISTRGAASLAEVGRTLATWPQLGGDVTLGAATIAAAIRRLGTGADLPSGRVRIDLDSLVATVATPLRPEDRRLDDLPPPVPPAPPPDPVDLIVHAASRAPSGGNVQPWRFEADERSVRIFLDPTRTSTMDVGFRGSYVAIGAALLNARVAAAHQGRLGPAEILAGTPAEGAVEGGRSPVAVLHLGTGRDPALARLYDGVLARGANRHRLAEAPPTIPDAVLETLTQEVGLEGARLRLVTDRRQLEALADLLAESERLRFLTPTLHAEMMAELRWPARDSVETGIDVRTLELDPADVATLSVAERPDVMATLARWGLGHALGTNARTAVRSSAALAAVTVSGSDPGGYVAGGAAVERLWLAAEQSGLAVQPISPVFVFAVTDADFATLGGQENAGALRALSSEFRGLLGLANAANALKENGRGGATSGAGSAHVAAGGNREELALLLRLTYAPPPSVRSMRLPLSEVYRRS